eukprot:4134092-Pleurochrysis_carterae.AAC.1
MLTTAWGALPRARAAAAATAQQPKSSAAGMETAGSGVRRPASCSSAARSACVATLRRSMHATSAGHHSETSHTTPGASAANTYPPTPSTPL